MEANFKVVDTEYGEAVAISFDYNEGLVERMRELRTDDNWQVTHCGPVYSDSDEFLYWKVDRTRESLKLLTQVTGLIAPEDVWPNGTRRSPADSVDDSGSNSDVRLVVPEGTNEFFVRGGGSEVDSTLDQMFSYDNPEAEHSAMAPPQIHLYDTTERCAPAGLADRAVIGLQSIGVDAEIIWEGDSSGPDADTMWLFQHPLRSYQREAVQAVLEQEGGIIALPTGGGKTVTALRLVHLVEQRAIIFVHTKELLHQWANVVRKTLGVEPGVIGDGKWSEGDQVTICTMQTLMSKGTHKLGDYGMAFYDECHRTSAADTMHELGQNIDVEWRIGLSATPWRRVNGEEMKIEGAVGGEAHSVSAEELIDDGHLSEPRFEKLHHDGPSAAQGEEYHEAYERCIEKGDARNKSIAQRAEDLAAEGYRVLVNVDRISQGEKLTEAVSNGPHKAAFLCGSDSTSVREEVLEDFKTDGGVSVLVSTLIKEGVDIPAIDAVILAHAGRSDISTLQVIGRALRPQGGKDHAVIVDVADSGRFFGLAHHERWSTMSEYYGSYGPGNAEARPDLAGQDGTRSLTKPMSEEETEELMNDLFGEE